MQKASFHKKSLYILLTGVLIFTSGIRVSAQTTGDFRSIASGDWSTSTNWETWNGAAWVAAGSVPSSTTSVYLEDGFGMTLSANSACKDLHINIEVNTGDFNRITTSSFTLSVSGKLRMYTGTAPGSNPGVFTAITSALIVTSGGGKIQIVGSDRDVIASSSEWGVPAGFTGWSLEFAMTSGQTARLVGNLRAGDIVITNGSIVEQVGGSSIRPDGGSAGTGNLTINSGGTLIIAGTGGASGLFRTSGAVFGTFTLSSGATLIIPATSALNPRIIATTATLAGTVTALGPNVLHNDAIGGAASVTSYNNLTLSAAITTFPFNISVSGTLTLGAKITTSSSATITLGSSASISGASSGNFIEGPLAVTIAATSATKAFEIGKGSDYRRVSLTVTHTTAAATVYTAEVFNTAPTSRTVPGTLTNVSGVRYWNITKGAGATLTTATATFTYGANDGVSDNTTLQIAKDDGAGNWTDLDGTGSAPNAGTITTASFSSFSDFVLANVSDISNGDFRSIQDGAWSSTSTWETYNSTSDTWVAAVSVPTSTTSVYIQDDDSVTLTANGACKDLHMNMDMSNADSGRVNTQSFTLSVNGKLRIYTGARGSIPGQNPNGTVTNNSRNFILTTGGGKIQIVGSSRFFIASTNEWGVPANFDSWNIEFAMNSGDTAKLSANFRAGNIVITSGSILEMQSQASIRPDNGPSNTGTLTVQNGGTLILSGNGGASGLFNASGAAFGALTVLSGGILHIPASVVITPRIQAQSVTINGHVSSLSSLLPSNFSVGAALNSFGKLTLGVATTMSQDITVDTLVLGAIVTTSSSAKLIMRNHSAIITGASSTKFVNGPLAITVSATNPGAQVFEIGKGSDYRKVSLTLTQGAATPTIYTAEVFNTAPTSRTLPGSLTNVSSVRYWNITKGAGATLTTATATFTYGANDGVSDNTALQIAKDDGAGNWTDLDGTGSAPNAGTITTNAFTSFSDFVLANIYDINNGDFRSIQDGAWSSTSTWETYNSTTATWVAAATLPTSSNNVYIQDDDSVTLTANGACKDLHLNMDMSNADSGRVNTQNFTLSVSGKMRLFTGAKGNIPGQNPNGTVTNNSRNFILTGSTGKIQIVGSSRLFITSSNEWGVPANFDSWNIEFAMNSGDTAKLSANFRAGNIVITSGSILQMQSSASIRPDNGPSNTGTLTVQNGGTLIISGNGGSSGLFNASGVAFGTLTVDAGGTIQIPSTVVTAPRIQAQTVTINGHVQALSSLLLSNYSLGAAVNSFGKLTLGVATTMSQDITVDTLVLGAIVTTSSSAKLIMRNHSAIITGASSTKFVNGPLAITVSATNPGAQVFEIGKGSDYRKVSLTLTQGAATPTIYTAEVFNTAPTSRTLPGSLTNVSSVRYWNITKGAGATLTTATATFTYGANDGVSDNTALQIAKDDGAGNWTDLDGTGSAPNAGTITTNAFTSFSDFVLANIYDINNGDFRSIQDGAWSSTSTWETYNSTTATWVAAATLPTSSNNVYIQDDDSVTLTANGACKDLHLNMDMSNADSGRVNTQNFTLSVSGKMRLFTGAKGNIPGQNPNGTVTNNSRNFILTGSTGKIQIVGSSRLFITSSNEWGVPANFDSWNIEFAMNSGDTAKLSANFRAGNIVITSGSILQMQSSASIRPDNGPSNTGTLTVQNGGTLIISGNGGSSGLFNASGVAFGTLTVDAGGTIQIPSTVVTAPRIQAQTVTINGHVQALSSLLLSNFSVGASLNSFGKLTINTATTLTQNLTIDTLALNAILTTGSSTKPILRTANGIISGASASAFVNGPLSYQNTSTSSKTMIFQIGKGTDYRKAELTVTQSTATSTTYTAEMFNSAPTSRTLPGSMDLVSIARFYTITSSGGSGISAGAVKLNYGVDDGVAQTSSLRIAKDNGAGAWLDLGGTGTGSPSGDITSTNNFTSFSDFVLGNATGGTNTLPVSWLSVNAEHIQDFNRVSWSTTNEINNKGFDVERSYDGRSFERIHFEVGKNISGVWAYSYDDHNFDPTFENIYYRLKQSDLNGRSEYSKTVRLSQEQAVTIYPNPSHDVFSLTVPSGSEVENLKLISTSTGQELSPAITRSGGNYEIDTRSLPKGLYIMQFLSNGKQMNRKIVLY